ncbi:MAG: hypothetical protein ACI9B7_000680 [Oleispira sp.]|jgi:hypothetical protein
MMSNKISNKGLNYIAPLQDMAFLMDEVFPYPARAALMNRVKSADY